MNTASDELCRLPADVWDALKQACAAWPTFGIEEPALLQHAITHLRPGDSLAGLLPGLHLSDLCCALGCMLAREPAYAAFEIHFLKPASSSLLRIDPSPDFADEVKQLVRQKLLLPGDGIPPRIAEYAARGPLQSWVRTALTRAGLNLKRDRRRDHGAPQAAPADDELVFPTPEELGIKESYRQALRAALTQALAALVRRDRTILRLYLVEGLNIERIGVIYGVHRATVARWIAATRTLLRELVLSQLASQLGMPLDEAEQTVGLLPSHIDLSLSRLLASAS